MNNYNAQNQTTNTILNEDLLKFVHTKSFFPTGNFHNILNTDLNPQGILDNNRSNTNTAIMNNPVDNDSSPNQPTELSDNYPFVQELIDALAHLCNEIHLNTEDSRFLAQGITHFMELFIQKYHQQEAEAKQLIYTHFKKLAGEDLQNNVLLIKRAAHWLGIDHLNSNQEYSQFLHKLCELGRYLSEDQGVRNEHHSFSLTKEEAKKARNALVADVKFKIALTNKTHPMHQEALAQIRNLNNIIVS